jgi:hypothetical protein
LLSQVPGTAVAKSRHHHAPKFKLSVSVDGPGTVTSDAGGIDCPDDDCKASFPAGAQVTLSAEPDGDATFSSWGDDCSSTPNTASCVLEMDANESASAVFASSTALEAAP